MHAARQQKPAAAAVLSKEKGTFGLWKDHA
jgi:hypothetical protein